MSHDELRAAVRADRRPRWRSCCEADRLQEENGRLRSCVSLLENVDLRRKLEEYDAEARRGRGPDCRTETGAVRSEVGPADAGTAGASSSS